MVSKLEQAMHSLPCDLHDGRDVGALLVPPEDVEGKVFNDCVHGHITLPPVCVSIIDTPEFQRMRNIKQTGCVYFLYPGASHNRFEHSLGVCYLAGQMVDALNYQCRKITATQKLCLQIAGLCHDLGHGPYSHTWELFLRRKEICWKHEDASVRMFDYLLEKYPSLDQVFSENKLYETERELIKEFIRGTGETLNSEQKYLYEIISNEENGIDVDKWDYLLRDGLQLNLKITFDYKRLLQFCRIIRVGDKNHICFQKKTETDVYNMFHMRTLLHHLAYQHNISKNIELMLVDALVEADNAGFTIKTKNMEFKLSEAHDNMEAFSCLTDHIFYDILYSHQQNLLGAQSIVQRILTRNLYILVGSRSEDVADVNVEERIKCLRNDVYKQLDTALESDKFGQDCFGIIMRKIDKGCKNITNPFNSIFFFKKSAPDVAEPINPRNVPVFGCSENCILCRIEALVFCKTAIDEVDCVKLKQVLNLD